MNKTGIIKAKEEKVKQDGSIFYKYKIEIDGKEISMSDFKGLNLHLNKTYDLDYDEKEGEFNGQPIIYRNINMAIESKEQKPIVTPANIYKPDIADRDTKIGRMAALNTSLEFIKALYSNTLMEPKNKDRLKEEWLDLAEELEKFVQR